MINSYEKQFRILAIAPSTRCVGFAVLDGEGELADWGAKAIRANRSAASLKKFEKLAAQIRPDVVVLEEIYTKECRRSPRIRGLLVKITEVARENRITVRQVTRQQINQVIVPEGDQTKQGIAEALVRKYPEQLSTILPNKRKPWESENYHMATFNAVALAVAYRGA